MALGGKGTFILYVSNLALQWPLVGKVHLFCMLATWRYNGPFGGKGTFILYVSNLALQWPLEGGGGEFLIIHLNFKLLNC